MAVASPGVGLLELNDCCSQALRRLVAQAAEELEPEKEYKLSYFRIVSASVLKA